MQFSPAETAGFLRVESRMFLSCESGSGDVLVDGGRIEIRPGTILVLPWGHRVHYEPDPRDPFFVYGVHLIPWHAAEAPVELAVPHHRDHPLAGSAVRSDADLGIGTALWRADTGTFAILHDLIATACRIWDRSTPTLAVARALGELLTDELRSAGTRARVTAPTHDLPVRLRRVVSWMTAEPGRTVTLDRMAEVAGVSPATVTRLFRENLGTSPLSWVLELRIDVAKSLLTTTNLPVGLVAARAGFRDAGYFSRQFRSRTRLTPSEWRRRRSA